jgi:hypothetical protein
MLKRFKRKNISNKLSYRINYKVELFGISILTIALIFLGWAYIFQESGKYKQSITDSFGANQEVMVNQVAKNVKGGLELYIGTEGKSP